MQDVGWFGNAQVEVKACRFPKKKVQIPSWCQSMGWGIRNTQPKAAPLPDKPARTKMQHKCINNPKGVETGGSGENQDWGVVQEPSLCSLVTLSHWVPSQVTTDLPKTSRGFLPSLPETATKPRNVTVLKPALGGFSWLGALMEVHGPQGVQGPCATKQGVQSPCTIQQGVHGLHIILQGVHCP